jgi:hypothetical protein
MTPKLSSAPGLPPELLKAIDKPGFEQTARNERGPYYAFSQQ